jgi:hypothetical protein
VIQSRFHDAVLVIGFCSLASLAWAQTGGGYDLTWSTIDGGGGTSTGGGFSVSGTIGQADAVSQAAPLSGGVFELVGGFWVSFGPACTSYSVFDFDEDCDVDLDDLEVFAACALGPAVEHHTDPICQQADVDSDGDIDQDDYSAFQRCFSGANKLADPDCASGP